MPVRKMPQNIEAEMSVLGVAFLQKNALVKICEELKKMGYNIDKKKILVTYPIDVLGTHKVKIELHKKVEGEIKVTLKK